MPAYALAPTYISGVYDLTSPMTILSGNKTYLTQKIEIFEMVNFAILSTEYGWYALDESHFDTDMRLAVSIGKKHRLLPPYKKIPRAEIIRQGFFIALATSRLPLATINSLIKNYRFPEITTTAITKQELERYYTFTLDSKNITQAQFELLVHSFLTTSKVLGTLKVVKGTEKYRNMTLRVQNNFWRDFIVACICCCGFDYKVSITNSGSVVYLNQYEVSVFLQNSVIANQEFTTSKKKEISSSHIHMDLSTQIIKEVDKTSFSEVSKEVSYSVGYGATTGLSFLDIPDPLECNCLLTI